MRMPSSLRSKIHSGPVNRSCVSVAAIGTTHSGKDIPTIVACGAHSLLRWATRQMENSKLDESLNLKSEIRDLKLDPSNSEWIDALACLCQDVRHTAPQGEIQLEESCAISSARQPYVCLHSFVSRASPAHKHLDLR